MNSATCCICGSGMRRTFTARILGQYDAEYWMCQECGFLQVADPHWLSEAYSEAIARTDTGLVARNLACARTLIVILRATGVGTGQVVDVAGGHGLLVRLLRDAGFDARWEDLYARNILAAGFDAEPSRPAAAVTACEVLEHVLDPLAFLTDIRRRWCCDSIYLTTETYAGDPPAPDQWAYYARETGQHIAFFQTATMRLLAERLGLHYRHLGGFHALTAKPLPPWLSLACGRPARILAPLLARGRSLTISDHDLLAGEIRRRQES
jgi:hypothetical protein